MKARPLRFDGECWHPCEVNEATHIEINTPGPYTTRFIPVILKGTRKGTGCWTWNGDTEKPTLKPSISTKGTVPITNEEADRILAGEKIEPKPLNCHTWITDGKVKFKNDCTHELAGQTLDLLELD